MANSPVWGLFKWNACARRPFPETQIDSARWIDVSPWSDWRAVRGDLVIRATNAGVWLRARAAAIRESLNGVAPRPFLAGLAVTFAALVPALLLFLAFADWNALRDPVARFAANASGRPIVIEGSLRVRPWSMRPRVDVERLRIGNPAWIGEGDMAVIDRAFLQLELSELFQGNLTFHAVELHGADVALYRDADGRSNWSSGRNEPLRLPAIRRFLLRDGQLRLADEKRNLTLRAQFNSNEAQGQTGAPFRLNGDGEINAQPFRIALAGASLLNVDRGRPYAFNADIVAGATRIRGAGAIDRPFDLSLYSADLTASGPDLADLYPLIGLVLPNTPPYALTGKLRHERSRYAFTDLTGRVGDSDIRGAFTVTSASVRGRTLLEADIASRALDWDDLLAVFGGAPSIRRGETASPVQRAIAAELAEQGRILPNATLDIRRVRNMDARVRYRAASVRSANWPVRSFAVDLTLDSGLLTMDPVSVGLPQGRVHGSAVINARHDTPRAAIDLRLAGARVESVLPRLADAVRGDLAGRARLAGTGATVRDAAASASGTVTLVIPRGEIREALAELAGVNVTRGLGLLLTEDEGTTAIRCAVASFDVRGGIMRTRSIVVDTTPVLIDGGGSVDLGRERMDIRLQGHPKEPRLVRVAIPISVAGPLRNPQINLETGSALGQGGVATALGALVAPLAALLPFVNLGGEDDADCRALLAEARSPRRG